MQHFRLNTAMLLAAVCLFMASSVSTKTVVTCENGRIHKLKCKKNEVISVQSALYGRADMVTCSQNRPSQQLDDTSCSASGTLNLIKERCEMKQKCQVKMRDVRNPDPCRGIFKYLQTDFLCVPAETDITCENARAKLHCGRGKVISVLSAYYGRRSRIFCPHPYFQTQNVNCENPTDIVADK
ncbi:hypothetical protein OJAV_G00062780 [Oryzias javanicus]|uniref:SUEL-type lectin domain-containing protein n=1 Tax=Oryzias javanicus TaxID=123683 RepID=A0A3S2UG75_ORYJA|nr:hypothetical protein OJAV_G00062780 [Oryzias javanicus]